MSNTTNTVIIIIHNTLLSKLNGKMIKWNIIEDDFIPAEGKVKLDVQVVYGNLQYTNGRRITLYLLPNLPVN